MALNSATQPLPTPRQLITSILTTLFESSTVKSPQLNVSNGGNSLSDVSQNLTAASTLLTTTKSTIKTEDDEPPSNPLKTLTPSQKALLTTLHVLIPPPTLLQALDLLDRRLVSKVRWFEEEQYTAYTGVFASPTSNNEPNPLEPVNENENEGESVPPPTQPENATSERRKQPTTPPSKILYQVRSSTIPSTHPTRSRYRDSASYSSHNKIYTVHLEAWNCNCAAFAFSACPYHAPSSTTGLEWRSLFPPGENDEDEDEKINAREDMEEMNEEKQEIYYSPTPSPQNVVMDMDLEDPERDWEFGGLSCDGRVDERSQDTLPVCKHLLAVLLGEKWGLVSDYVEVKDVFGWRGRDEIAGLALG